MEWGRVLLLSGPQPFSQVICPAKDAQWRNWAKDQLPNGSMNQVLEASKEGNGQCSQRRSPKLPRPNSTSISLRSKCLGKKHRAPKFMFWQHRRHQVKNLRIERLLNDSSTKLTILSLWVIMSVATISGTLFGVTTAQKQIPQRQTFKWRLRSLLEEMATWLQCISDKHLESSWPNG